MWRDWLISKKSDVCNTRIALLTRRGSAVVAGQDDIPVVVFFIKTLHEAGGRIGGFERVQPFIDLPIDAQAEEPGRRGHELPGALGPGPRRGVDPNPLSMIGK